MQNPPQDTENKPETTQDNNFVSVLIMTFTTVFLAELGDKTQIATLLLTAQSGKPFTVFLGAASALICSSLVGVLIGRWLSTIISPNKFKYMAGISMIAIGLWIGVQASNSLINS